MRNLIGWQQSAAPVAPAIRPAPLTHEQWPPDYAGIMRWRTRVLRQLITDPDALAAAKVYYSTRPAEFIMDWMDTYDPRRTDNRWIPFVFFSRQADLIEFVEDLLTTQQSGLVEKCRDAGLTWLLVGWSVHAWLFRPEIAVGWGSRKEMLVDRAGDADSIFEKMRLVIRRLPRLWLPADFKWSKHATSMKLVNPNSGASITGEGGDNIGRGGRKSIYVVDEAAHLERPEKVDAALSANTNVRIDISSVNGVGNVFHRRRESGVLWTPGGTYEPGYVRVFVMDWRDHPAKTQEWYDTNRARYEREGLQHLWAQEVDRNYAAAVDNVVIPYEWVEAAVDAHLRLDCFKGYNPDTWGAGLDVADEGSDRSALTLRQGVIWRQSLEWGERDPDFSARKAVLACREYKGRIACMYDSIGIGSAVKTEYNRLCNEGIINAADVPFVPWNAARSPLNPTERVIPDDDNSLLNRDFYDNIKAQAWWSLRTRFYKTYKAINEGVQYLPDELISLDSTMPLLQQVMKELKQPTRGESRRLKMLINKNPDGTRSPNLADSGVMAFFPVPLDVGVAEVGTYGY